MPPRPAACGALPRPSLIVAASGAQARSCAAPAAPERSSYRKRWSGCSARRSAAPGTPAASATYAQPRPDLPPFLLRAATADSPAAGSDRRASRCRASAAPSWPPCPRTGTGPKSASCRSQARRRCSWMSLRTRGRARSSWCCSPPRASRKAPALLFSAKLLQPHILLNTMCLLTVRSRRCSCRAPATPRCGRSSPARPWPMPPPTL